MMKSDNKFQNKNFGVKTQRRYLKIESGQE